MYYNAPMTGLLIQPTQTELTLIRALFREYAQSLPIPLDFQGFDEELAHLPGKYTPPLGGIWLAWDGPQPVGCVAMRPFDPGRAELKRLYVRPDFRHRGIAEALTQTVIQAAKKAGYQALLLDTLESMTPAITLYTKLGFHRINAYYPNPYPTAYFELKLN